ncbi:M28 family peptidase [Pendulispora rubella]|uniref:M28 family peptidase n=1 Tax=Pendulispora rubella TaxID=2741070 RepID=A0ABZ2LAV0_9BACT
MAIGAEEKALAARMTAESIAGPTRFLSDDKLEGRAPGSRGGQLAVEYLASEFRRLGLQPGGDGGTYFQRVPLVALTPEVKGPVTFSSVTKKENSLSLASANDLVIMSGVQETRVRMANAELVFAGYGIVAPEYQWDDYKDVDVRGKVVVVMNNDPSSDPTLFEGKRRLWYGRWDYKYLQAAKKGAAGVIIVHTTESAGYPWQVVVTSNALEKFELPATKGEPRLLAKMWATEDASRRIAALGGENLDALRQAAERRDFRPRALNVKLDLDFTNKRRDIESANVLGVLPGRDPELSREAVVYSAHHDHLGIGAPRNGDSIYNGAVDNASGSGTLVAMAGAFAGAESKPRRSIVFAAVAAEEQGLLGSQWYCEHPTFPAGRIAADLNMDSMNIFGPTRDLGFVGLGKSSLDDVVTALATAQGRTLHGDAFPDRGSFYRSDQFSFAKIGVPSIYIKGGPEYVGRPPGWGKEQQELFERTRYHQPSDEFDPNWDLRGAVEDAQLLLLAGWRIANAPELPTWKKGDEFANVPRPRQ